MSIHNYSKSLGYKPCNIFEQRAQLRKRGLDPDFFTNKPWPNGMRMPVAPLSQQSEAYQLLPAPCEAEHYQRLLLSHQTAYEWATQMALAKQAMAKGFIALGLKGRQRSNLLGDIDVLLHVIASFDKRSHRYPHF